MLGRSVFWEITRKSAQIVLSLYPCISDLVPHRALKKGPSRTFEQRPPHELGQAHCSRAAGHAAGCTILRIAPGAKGRPEVFGYQPRRHSYIAGHPLKMAPGAEIGKKSIFDLPPWGPP